jgi:hypothetical protein
MNVRDFLVELYKSGIESFDPGSRRIACELGWISVNNASDPTTEILPDGRVRYHLPITSLDFIRRQVHERSLRNG